MTKREAFMQKNKKFFEAGFINEIYGNENVSILNICNSLYAVSQYAHDKNFDYGACIVDVNHIKRIIDDNTILPVWINNMSDEQLSKLFIQLNEKTYEIMKDIKARTDAIGPSEHIDLEYEESLKQKKR